MLRDLAPLALKQRGDRVAEVAGRGLIPGSRLTAISEGADEQRTVAVRVSLDQEIALTRRPDNQWVTLGRVDEIIVVIPAADDSDRAEIFSIRPDVLIASADEALSRMKRDVSYRTPVFVSFADEKHGGKNKNSLRGKATWQTSLPFALVRGRQKAKAQPDTIREILGRAKHEIAHVLKMDDSEVSLRLEITPKFAEVDNDAEDFEGGPPAGMGEEKQN
jgi:hypothetical protein